VVENESANVIGLAPVEAGDALSNAHLTDEGTYGKGAMMVVSPASNAVAPTVPSLAYIAGANSGNPAANELRIALFAAMADAAIGRYATTRYVKVDVKTK